MDHYCTHKNILSFPIFKTENMVRVLVLGASGYIGKATLTSLVERHPEVKAFAGVRDPSKFEPIKGVTPVKADMGNEAELAKVLKDYQRVFIVTPGTFDRRELATSALKAAKKAGVQFVLLLSVSLAGTDTVFGKQFGPLEEDAKKLALNLTIVRFPIFVDNFWGSAQTIKEQGTFYDPRDPTKPHTPVVVSDAGKASAAILANPTKFIGNTYHVVSPPFSLNNFAAALSKALGKEVKPTTVPYSAAKEAMMGFGIPDWQADGINDIYKSVDEGSPRGNDPNTGDFELITGEKALTMEQWVEQNAAGFK